MLHGVYRRTDGEPVFVEVPAPTDEALQALLHKNISRLMKLLTRRGVLIEEGNSASDEARSRCRRRLPRIEWVSPHVAGRKCSRCKVACRETPRSLKSLAVRAGLEPARRGALPRKRASAAPEGVSPHALSPCSVRQSP